MSCFALLFYVGPSSQELFGAQDLLESLFHYEPFVQEIVVIDDGNRKETLRQALPVPPQTKLTIIPNPRNGKGYGWLGGTSAALTAGLNHLSFNRSIEFVIKLDTDSLVIAPFSEKVSRAFRVNPDIGMLGSHTVKPFTGQEMDRPTEAAIKKLSIKKLSRPFTIWRRTPGSRLPSFQIGSIGRYGKIRRMLHQALANGYVPGEMCQGGGLAVSSAAIGSMAKGGLLSDPLLWMKTPCGDDVVLAIYVRAVGFRPENFCGSDEPFATKYKGLPAPPQVLLDYGYSIIHSVKDHQTFREAETRAFFREIRKTEFQPAAYD